MNVSKNKNTPNPTAGSVSPENKSAGNNVQSKDRDNAIENIKTSHPTKK
ncbi:MAG: hypothetical protein H7X94_14955 [Vallitaleaceae bacterium]|nr:hypothetical protein [Vallitaleaceae bacterium]